MKAKIKIWLEDKEGKMIFGDGKADLLLKIDELGSLSKAAKACGIEYKKAWRHIHTIESNIQEIILRKKGGKNGGGSELTPKEENLSMRIKNCVKFFIKIVKNILRKYLMENLKSNYKIKEFKQEFKIDFSISSLGSIFIC